MNNVIAKNITEEADLKKAFAIREQVFVVEQKVSKEDEFDEFEEESAHFMATINNEPAGAARWRRTNNGIKLERFAVKMDYRGMGIGKALVQTVLDHIQDSGVPGKLYLHAQLDAIPLYEHFNFKIVGEQFTECGIEHREMELVR